MDPKGSLRLNSITRKHVTISPKTDDVEVFAEGTIKGQYKKKEVIEAEDDENELEEEEEEELKSSISKKVVEHNKVQQRKRNLRQSSLDSSVDVATPMVVTINQLKLTRKDSKLGKLVTRRLTTREAAKLKLVTENYNHSDINELLARILDPANGLKTKKRKIKGQVHENTWRGGHLCKWLTTEVTEHKASAIRLANLLLEQDGLIIALTDPAIHSPKKILRNEFYTFANQDPDSSSLSIDPPPSSSSSSSSSTVTSPSSTIRIEPFDDSDGPLDWERRNSYERDVPLVTGLLSTDLAQISPSIISTATDEQLFSHHCLLFAFLRHLLRSGKATFSIIYPFIRVIFGRFIERRFLKSRLLTLFSNEEFRRVFSLTMIYHSRPYLTDEEKLSLRAFVASFDQKNDEEDDKEDKDDEDNKEEDKGNEEVDKTSGVKKENTKRGRKKKNKKQKEKEQTIESEIAEKDWTTMEAVELYRDIYRATFEQTAASSSIENKIQSFDTLLLIDSIDVQTQSLLVDKFNSIIEFNPGQILDQSCIQHPLAFNYNPNSPTRVVVEKIFTSIARPALISFRQIHSGTIMLDADSWDEVKPRMIYKQGDNLMQDLGVESMFKIFNTIWAQSFPNSKSTSSTSTNNNNNANNNANNNTEGEGEESKTQYRPYCHSYEVFPTGKNIDGTHVGFLEVVDNTESFKTFNWQTWGVRATEDQITRLVTSAAGAYIAGYILGVRDRHWDNILIRNHSTLLHIDFGYILGSCPPIDAPKLSISSEMKIALIKKGKWELFVNLVISGYLALRRQGEKIIHASKMIFGMCLEMNQEVVEAFMRDSLQLTDENREERLCGEKIRYYVEDSSVAWQNYFKQFSHKTIDPLWYGLLRRHFPPAVAIMAKVEESHKGKVEALREEAGGATGTGAADGGQMSDVPLELRRHLLQQQQQNNK